MDRVIYIAGLGHSGSTLLNFLLGAHPETVGIGVGFGLFAKPDRITSNAHCTCGAQGLECPFWGPILLKISDLSEEAYYRYLLDASKEAFGDRVIVDSSKKRRGLDLLSTLDVDLRAVYLVRDVRAWAYSRKRKALASDNFSPWKNRYSKFFKIWRRRNEQFIKHFSAVPYPHIVTTYEALCLNTEETLASVSEFMGLTFHSDMLRPEPTQQHFLRGNRMRHTKELRIRYDDKWNSDVSLSAQSLIAPRAMRLNRILSKDVPNHF